ncbi:MAG TPA: TolC family protein [Blastocatellia bacterium]|nr:TolC family protein [Blastocatellia bacterium]
MQRKLVNLFGVALLIACASAGARGSVTDDRKAKLPAANRNATSELLGATANYKASVEKLLPIYESGLKAATEVLETRQELFGQGLISKRELEEAQQAVKDSQRKLDEARRQLAESDQLVSNARAELDAARSSPALRSSGRVGAYITANAILRYRGSPGWTIAQASKVENFFASNFGRGLPISAYGQSATHNRMGLDHRDSVDVALSPDSREGKALMTFLQNNAIPFLAFRTSIPGAATGAHIHIGYPSHKTS